MSTELMDSFSPLDEMIQLIYQSIHQFVVMSSVTSDKWTIHVGMVGDAGRWWRGVWEEKDIVGVVGPKPSEKLLEAFVDKLVDSIVGGELYLAGFSTEKGAKFKLTLGPTNTKPVSIDLEEIEPREAAAHATNVFLEIALQAQSRRCRLHSSAFTSIPVPSKAGTSTSVSRVEAGGDRAPDRQAEKVKLVSDSNSAKARPKTPETDIEMKGTELDTQASRKEEKEKHSKRLRSPSEKTQPQSDTIRPKAGAGKGVASLAKPTKKARKIQAMEFESDED